MTDKKQPSELRVIDLSATAENTERVHDIVVDGQVKQVRFSYGKETVLPYNEGIKFLQSGFLVLEPGQDNPMVPAPKTDETIRFRIAEDEVVAKLDELTNSSLKLRVAARPGGEKLVIGAEFDREAAISFLKGAQKPKAAVADEDLIDDEDEDKDGIVGDPLAVNTLGLECVKQLVKDLEVAEVKDKPLPPASVDPEKSAVLDQAKASAKPVTPPTVVPYVSNAKGGADK